ncbi:MAG: hypothetical protein ACQESR_26545 [Planctomycetota bacterium]
MADRNRKTQTYGPIRDTSKTPTQIDASKVQAALGGEPADLAIREIGMGPLSMFQVREELFQRLQSTGGRPWLAGTSRRTKIPLSDRQWEELEDIATDVASPGFSPSPGQIASVLISLSLRSLRGKEGADQSASEQQTRALDGAGG